MKTPSPRRNETESTPSTSTKAPGTIVKKKTTTDKEYLISNADASMDLEAFTKTAKQLAGSEKPELVEKLQQQMRALLKAKEKEVISNEQKWNQERANLHGEIQSSKKGEDTAKRTVSELTVVVNQYEATVGQIMNKTNRTGAKSIDVDALRSERNQLADDVRSLENSFSELYKRYEKLRTATEDMKKNEDILKRTIDEYKTRLIKSEDRFNRLKDHAEEKLEKANEEIERLMKARDTDTVALRAKLKQRDAQVDTMEKSLEAKQREIQELTNICDELIQKAGLGAHSDTEQ